MHPVFDIEIMVNQSSVCEVLSLHSLGTRKLTDRTSIYYDLDMTHDVALRDSHLVLRLEHHLRPQEIGSSNFVLGLVFWLSKACELHHRP